MKWTLCGAIDGTLRAEAALSGWSLENAQRRFARLAWWVGLGVLAVALVVVLSHGVEHGALGGGQTQGVQTIRKVLGFLEGNFTGDMVEMSGSTALPFIVCALALLASLRPPSTLRRLFVLGGSALVIGWASFVLLRSTWNRPIKLPDYLGDPPMSVLTAVLFLVAGLTLVATHFKSNLHARRLASVGVCALGLVSLVILIGYADGIEYVRHTQNVPIALLSAATFLLLGVGLTFALGPGCFPLRPFVGASPRPTLLRSFLPVAVGFVLAGSLVHGVLYGLGFSREVVLVLSSALCLSSLFVTALVVGFLSERIGGTIEDAEAKRDKALDEMARVNGLLAEARDQAEQRAVDKDLFLATVSHELRTPLNHVIGFIQLLALTELDDDQQRDLAKIDRAANNLLGLVNDLLDYQKIIQGSLTLEPTALDLPSWVEEVADSMRPKAAEGGNKLVVDCPADIGTLEVDEKRARQALTNLLSNAAKFTRDGVITVRVGRESDGAREWVRVDVRDTGRGMTPDEQAKLFQPFTKLLSRSENPDGTGLGLALSQRLCRVLGGDLVLSHSQKGRGSTFTLRLPAGAALSKPASGPSPVRPGVVERGRPSSCLGVFPSPPPRGGQELEAPGKPVATLEAPGPHRKPLSVLVIDDDPEVRELMQRHLQGQGFVVHLAASGAEGLDMVKRVAPDAITLDVLMPGIDGWGTLAALREDEKTADIPVIIVTLLDDRKRGFALGAWEVLTKPVNWCQLIELLRQLEPTAGPVLLVDDDQRFCLLAEETLKQHGWEVCCAAEGQAALDTAAGRRPALVLLELEVPPPGMDGFAFLEAFRKEPAWREVPVVVVTGKELTEQERVLLRGSVLRVLPKGRSTVEELVREVERLMLSQPGRPKSPGRAVVAG